MCCSDSIIPDIKFRPQNTRSYIVSTAGFSSAQISPHAEAV